MVLVPEGPGSSNDLAAPVTGSSFADSFDNLDEVLDDLHTSPASESVRWKTHAETGGTGNDTSELDPIDGDVTDFHGAVDPIQHEWANPAGELLKKCSLIGGGVLLGSALAVGLIVFMAPKTNQSPPAALKDPATTERQSAATIRTLENDHTAFKKSQPELNAPSTTTSITPDTNPEDVVDSSVVAQIANQELAAENLDVADGGSPDPRTGDAIPNQPIDDAQLPERAADNSQGGLNTPGGLNTSDSLIANQDEVQSRDALNRGEESASDAVLLEMADELTDFAKWLGDASSDEPPRETPLDDPLKINPAGPADDAERVGETPVIPPPITRSLPTKIDVEARLAETVPAIQFKSVPLNSVLRSLSRFSTIPTTIDPNALNRRRLSPRQPITLRKINGSVSDVMHATLNSLKLTLRIDDGHVVVTTKSAAENKPIQHSHDVSDLVESDAEGMELLERVVRFVDRSAWAAHGGEAECAFENGKLIVRHTDVGQFQVLRFLERLRVARGLSQTTNFKDETFSLTPRLQLAEHLGQSISLRMPSGSTLMDIADEIEERIGAGIVIDWQALHDFGWAPRDEMTYFCDRKKLEDALKEILHARSLTFVVRSSDIIQITSQSKALNINDVEFYAFDEAKQREFADLLSVLRKKYPGAQIETAFDSGGATIVSAPQIVQREIVTLVE